MWAPTSALCTLSEVTELVNVAEWPLLFVTQLHIVLAGND